MLDSGFCLLTSAFTLPSAIRNCVAGPKPGLRSFSPGKSFWTELGDELVTGLSVLPHPCCWTGRAVLLLEDLPLTYAVLYAADFPTSSSHPSCPRIYLPPPRLGPLPGGKVIFVLAITAAAA